MSVDQVACVGWTDLNTPHAKGKDATKALAMGMNIINGMSPMMNSSVMLMSDHAKGSSMRGLYDEEKQISEQLFANRQHCDTRFVELFGKTKGATTKRFGTGRIVVDYDTLDSNIWIARSELSCAGRPLGEGLGVA